MADAFQAWVEVLPDFRNFSRKASSEMSDILGVAGTAGGITAGRNIGDGLLGGIRGLAGPIVGVVAALGIGKLIGDAIGTGIRYTLDSVGLASDLGETRSAITQVFGDAAADIESYAQTANRSLGQTRQDALQGAQTFGVFGKAAGLTGKPLATFSTGLVGLSADLASFFNTSPADAIDAIGAGLRGEAEPLRRFGVLLDDATLKQRALTLGIYDGSGSLTSQQRVLAAQAEIFAQTNIAQGDFERTSGGLANQQRILEASLEDTQAKLGEALLPAFTELVAYANDELIPKLDGVIERVGPKIADALDKSGPAFERFLTATTPLLEKFATEGIPAIAEGAARTAEYAATVSEMSSQAQSDLTGFWAWLTTPVGGDTWMQTTAEGWNNFWDVAWDGTATTAHNKSEEIKRIWTSSIDSTVLELNQKGIDWIGVGEHYGDGLAEGFRNKKSTIRDAAALLANEAIGTVKGLMNIKSPSRVMAEIGGYVAEGFAIGITDGAPGVNTAMRSLVQIPSVASPQVGLGSAGGTPMGRFGGDINITNPDPYVTLAMVKQELAGRLGNG